VRINHAFRTRYSGIEIPPTPDKCCDSPSMVAKEDIGPGEEILIHWQSGNFWPRKEREGAGVTKVTRAVAVNSHMRAICGREGRDERRSALDKSDSALGQALV
jgi:hypothetical protein